MHACQYIDILEILRNLVQVTNRDARRVRMSQASAFGKPDMVAILRVVPNETGRKDLKLSPSLRISLRPGNRPHVPFV